MSLGVKYVLQSGTWLRIITDKYYYILNPTLIKYHKMLVTEKVF